MRVLSAVTKPLSATSEHPLGVSHVAPPQSTSSDEPRSALWSFLEYSTILAVALDLLSITLGLLFTLAVARLLAPAASWHARNEALTLVLQYTLIFWLFGRIHSIYSYSHSLLQVRATANILRVSVFSMLILAVEALWNRPMLPPMILIAAWIVATLIIVVQKNATRSMFARLRSQNGVDRRVLILGTGSEARRIFSFLLNSPDMKLHPVAFLSLRSSLESQVVYSHDYRFRDHAPVYSGSLTREFLSDLEISEIIVVDPTLSPQDTSEIAAVAAEQGATLSFVASAQPQFCGRPINFRVMDGIFVSSPARDEASGPGYEPLKRTIDVLLALLLMIASFPFWLVAALWIKSTSEGPIFFKQERIGMHGKPFQMYKFRSMYITAPRYGRSPEHGEDPRITPAGRYLRKSSIDELPQLINVLRGEMSLVGPRPEMPFVVEGYTPQQRLRLSVKPGLSGIWQLSADRKHAIHESIEYDMYYIENRGIFLDFAILLHTLAFAMKGV